MIKLPWKRKLKAKVNKGRREQLEIAISQMTAFADATGWDFKADMGRMKRMSEAGTQIRFPDVKINWLDGITGRDIKRGTDAVKIIYPEGFKESDYFYTKKKWFIFMLYVLVFALLRWGVFIASYF